MTVVPPAAAAGQTRLGVALDPQAGRALLHSAELVADILPTWRLTALERGMAALRAALDPLDAALGQGRN